MISEVMAMKLLQILHKHKMKKSVEIDIESAQSTAEKERTEQSKELLNKQRLSNLINKVKELCRSFDFQQRKAVFYIIKIYADKINCGNNTDVLESQIDKRPFQDATSFYGEYRYNLNKSFRIDLGKAPVITYVWRKSKLVDALTTLSANNGKFKENDYNHRYSIFFPLGLTIVFNGNHSANSAIIKSEGFLEYRPGVSGRIIYDLSPLYSKFYFDGTYYRDKQSDEIIEKTSFEYGCLFEIGRVLTENNMNYFDYFKEIFVESAP